MACSKPCGAISIIMESLGICLDPSSKRTELNRLLVWYSADENLAKSESHFDSSIEVLIHLELRGSGSVMTSFRYFSRSGPAGLMYLLWYAMLDTLTNLAKMSLLWSSLTNSSMSSVGPEIVELSGPLWQATSIVGGNMSLILS